MATATEANIMDEGTEERDRQIVKLVREGELNYRQIGARFNVSHARVGQIVAALDPDASEVGARARAERAKAARPAPVKRERPTTTRTCPVCDRQFKTADPRRRTCSGILPTPDGSPWAGGETCASIWHQRGYSLRTEEYLRRQGATARFYLKDPARWGKVKADWAARFLAEHPEFATVEPRGESKAS